MGAGKRAAADMDRFLRGETEFIEEKVEEAVAAV